jgi:arylsulfate sulfotransferase
MYKKVTSLLVLVILFTCGAAPGVALLSGPTFTPSTNAVLAGLLRVTTDVDSRVSVSVSDGIGSWTRNFHVCTRTHSLPLAGFKPGRTNQILVTVFDQLQNAQTASQPLVFVTPPLPADFPHSVVLHSEPDKMEPGYTLFIVQNRTAKKSYITMMDNQGEVIWYSPSPALGDLDVRQLSNGDLFIEEQAPLNRFLEINLLGEIVNTLPAPSQYPVNNHEGLQTDHGTILYLSDVSRVVSNFPSSGTDPQAPLKTATVDDNPVVEISATNGALLNAWAPIDLLDPTRVTYLTYQFPSPSGVDNEHANAVIEDKNDNSIIVSLRDQNAVFKFLRTTGQLKWILAPHDNWGAKYQPYLLKPVGTPFAWSYGQHAPEITPQHTLLLYDDGNQRAEPFAAPVADQNNYSRAVEYKIDETTMEISQVWDSSQLSGDRLYTGAVGDADWLSKSGNVLATYGFVSYVNGAHPSPYSASASMARIIEMTHDQVPHVVFDVSFFDSNNTQTNFSGYICYRSDRIPDLYAHPLLPVQDLSLTLLPAGPLLRFSGDPARTYSVITSTDHQQWQQIGIPVPGPQPDTFEFQDVSAGSMAARFYRIVGH